MIIGLSGYAGSGKDEVGRALVELCGFRRFAFADALKDIAELTDPKVWSEATFGFERLGLMVQRDGWDAAKAEADVRRFLQRLGASVRDVLGDDTWIRPLVALIGSGASNIVVTDVRYSNEAREIVAHGGEIWRITRPGVGPANGHVSESALDGWPCHRHIYNDSTVDRLRHEAKMLARLAVWP